MQVGPQDVVFFYYSGHGARSPGDKTRWPQLAFKDEKQQTTVKTSISLYKVDQILAAKNPKFRVVLADCCNSIVPTLPAKSISKDPTRVENPQARIRAYQQLFAQPTGNILCSSSLPGQPSKATVNGGAFTIAYLDMLNQITKGNTQAHWNFLLEGTKAYTKKIAGHEPQFEIKIENQPYSQPLLDPADEDTYIDVIMSIADQTKSHGQRLQMIHQVTNQVFATDAIVEVYGKNGKTLLEREKATKFIRRLSVSGYIVDIVEFKVEKNRAGKITKLQIHEIYKL